MKRTKFPNKINDNEMAALSQRLESIHQIMNAVSTRLDWSSRLGVTYQGERKLYRALGYATDQELTYSYYWNKYDRDSVATAIIDRPAEATWNGDLAIVEEGKKAEDSQLNKAWKQLNKDFRITQRLNKLDKLSGIGRYALLLFGFDEVKTPEDWKKPTGTGKKTLKYLKQIEEPNAYIETWETDSSNERFGKPLTYKIKISDPADTKGVKLKEILVHHSRVLHVTTTSLTSEVYGRPRLKPVINRLDDLEKILGGDAEMFWRGARPGYTALSHKDFELGAVAKEALYDELDKYENDLRRFITAQGVDIKALEQQVADPTAHVDVQIQAISAQTGIPKRILIGSERGELSSSQDRDMWLGLITTRMEKEAEPDILRPFINKCMEHKILPKVDNYTVIWEDVFAPSEKDKVEVGSKRAVALKTYADSIGASEILSPELMFKYIMGFSDEVILELENARKELVAEEDRLLAAEAEEERTRLEEEGTGLPQPRLRRRQSTTSSNGQ